MSHRGEPPAPTWPAVRGGRLPLRRILVVHTQRLGDIVCATPLFTALRNQFPSVHLTALVHRPMDQLLATCPALDEVLAYDRRKDHRSLGARLRLARELRSRRFDWALSIHAASSAAFALAQARIPWRTCVWRYGMRRPPHWWRLFHQHVRQDRLAPGRHEVEHNLDVLRELGIEPRPDPERVSLTPEERTAAREWLVARGRDPRRPLALLHPGHGGGRQVWPPEAYGQLAGELAARGVQIGVTGSPGERSLAEQVAATASVPVLQLAGETGLRELCAVIGEARLFVSVPTGPMHVASALGIPVVALYGPSDLRIDLTRFPPYQSPYRAVESPVACPCPGHRRCPDPVCMRAIAVEPVLHAALELLADG